MKIDRAAYTKTFPVGVYWEKVHLECSLDDTEDPIKAVLLLKEEVEKAHKLANPQLYKNGEGALIDSYDRDYLFDSRVPFNNSPSKPLVINRKYEEMEVIIRECETLEDLAKHKEYCGKHPDLMPHYMNKLKELSGVVKV